MATQVQPQGVNVFELLGIDPEDTWTQESVKQAREDARKRWNTDANRAVGPIGERARLNRERLTQLILDKVFDSQEMLERHAQQARENRNARHQQLRQALEDEIAFAALKGEISNDEIEKWVNIYKPVASREDIEAKAAPHREKPHETDDLSPAMLRQIDEKLEVLGLTSLYAAIGLQEPPSEHDNALQTANRVAADAHSRGTRSAEWTVRYQLASHAVTVFGSEVQTKQYFRHWRQQEFFRRFLQPYQATCEVTHELTTSQVEFLLKQAVVARWDHTEALESLFGIAYERKWRMALPRVKGESADAEMRLQLEHYKLAFEAEQDQREQAERQKKAADKKLADTEAEMRITRAQAAQAEKDRTAALERDARRQADIGNLQAKLREAEEREQALKATQRAQTTRNREQLDQARQDAERLREELNATQKQHDEEIHQRIRELAPKLQAHMAHSELMQAQAIIKSFPTVPPQWAGDVRQIESGIAQAKDLLNKAKRDNTSPARREELLAQALAACADSVPVLEYRQGLHPAPPTELRAVSDARGVSLTWEPSASPAVSYNVLRKAGSAPISVHDGDRLATVKECGWHDPAPSVGRSLFYAVFAVRGPLVSAQAAQLTRPVLLAPDVTALHVEVSDTTVTLTWSAPAGCSGVIVVRREGTAPQSINDGVRQAVHSANRYTDGGLQNGRTYFYRLYTEYLDNAGQAHRSGGVVTSATPETPPQTVPALTLRGTDGIMTRTVNLSAEPPERGELCVYRSGEAPAVTSGERVPDTTLGRVFGASGYRLPSMSDSLFAAGLVYYTPVVLFQGTAYIGEPQRYSYLPDVGKLQAVQTESGVRLSWQWPPRCEEAEVSWAPANSITGSAKSAIVQKAGADRAGSYDLAPLGRGQFSMQVRARYRIGDQVAVSGNQIVTVHIDRPIVVHCAVRTAPRLIGGWQYVVELVADEPVVLPALRVLAKEGVAPIRIDDGMVSGTLPAQSHPGRKWTIPLARFPLGPATQIAVFTEPGDRAGNVTFVMHTPG